MKIAWFTPFGKTSAIGNFSSQVCRTLRQSHDVTVYASDLASGEDAWPLDLPLVCVPITDPDRIQMELGAFDAIVYNMGNHYQFHRHVYEHLERRPGIVVMHDLVVRDFFQAYYLAGPDLDLVGLLRLMETCHGPVAADWLHELTGGRIPDPWKDPRILRYHMARAAVSGSYGVVTHSAYAREAIAPLAGAPVIHLDFPAPPLASIIRARHEHPRPPGGDRASLLTFGVINPNKLVHGIIEAIGQSPRLRNSVRYSILGAVPEETYRQQLTDLIKRYQLNDVVRLLGRLPDEQLHEHLFAADIVVNLRKPHVGESSWSLLESLFAGRPTVVWDHGFYGEFPGEVVRKVSSDRQLGAVLEELVADAPARRALGERGRQFAFEKFDTDRYCRAFVEFVQAALANRALLDLTDSLADRVAEFASEFAADSLLIRLADELAYLAA